MHSLEQIPVSTPGRDENVENVTTETAKISNSSNKRKLRPTQ